MTAARQNKDTKNYATDNREELRAWYDEVGRAIHENRRLRNLSLAELARAARIETARLDRLERGAAEVLPEEIFRLSVALKQRFAVLMAL